MLLLLVVLFRNRIQFDWPSFLAQLRHVSWGHIVAGIAIIYASYFLRALRWSIFLKAAKRVSALSLVGSQFIGFTAISLFGRFADLSRPYIIGKRMHLSFASQVAVYTIERMFDLGAAAVIFSLSLTATPAGSPNHKVFVRAGVISFAATAGIAIFAAAVYVAGNAVAAFLKNALGRISSTAGQQAGEKVLAFRHGLIAISSVSDLVSAAAVSLLMWATVGEAYVQTMHAFPQAPRAWPHPHLCQRHAHHGRQHGRLAHPAAHHRLVHPDRHHRRRPPCPLRRPAGGSHRLRSHAPGRPLDCRHPGRPYLGTGRRRLRQRRRRSKVACQAQDYCGFSRASAAVKLSPP